MALSVKTVGVVGTGVIGASWTLLFLSQGLQVIVTDPSPTAEAKIKEYLTEHWPTVEKIGLHESASLNNYKFIKDITPELPSLDFVQENAPEKVELKRSLLASLDAGLRPEVVIASSSSGLPSSQFVQKCNHPERVLIGHPFNPPHMIPLVEVVPHEGTSAAAAQLAIDFYKSIGKAPILLKKECPGFVANRLQTVLCHEAYNLVTRGLVSAEDLDLAVTSGLGLRWAAVGPLMTNALGGGGGPAGFRHMFEHLGPASDSWFADARAHEVDYSKAEAKTALMGSVDKMLEGTETARVEAQRDELLIEIIAKKAAMR